MAGGELSLPSFGWAEARDPLNEATLAAIAAGVSTRRYAGTLDPLPVRELQSAVSRSCVSRRFVALSAAQLDEHFSQCLEKLEFPVVLVDGIHFRERIVLVALGIDSEGEKHVLGLGEGGTENATVVKALLADLVDRGLDPERSRLWVIDGAKASQCSAVSATSHDRIESGGRPASDQSRILGSEAGCTRLPGKPRSRRPVSLRGRRGRCRASAPLPVQPATSATASARKRITAPS